MTVGASDAGGTVDPLDAVIARVDPPPEHAPASGPALGRFGRFLDGWELLGGASRPQRPILLHLRGAAAGVAHDLRTEVLPSAAEAPDYVSHVIDLIDRLVDEGADAFVLCDPEEPTVSTRATIGLLTQSDAVGVTGHDTDDVRWMAQAGGIRDAMRRGRPQRGTPLLMVRELDVEHIGVAAVALVCAAARRVPVLLDGTTSLAAALVAMRLAYRGRGWWLATHRPDDPAATAALTRLDLEPLVDLGLRRGGVGSLLVLRMVAP